MHEDTKVHNYLSASWCLCALVAIKANVKGLVIIARYGEEQNPEIIDVKIMPVLIPEIDLELASRN